MQIEKRPSVDQGEREGAWGKKKNKIKQPLLAPQFWISSLWENKSLFERLHSVVFVFKILAYEYRRNSQVFTGSIR